MRGTEKYYCKLLTYFIMSVFLKLPGIIHLFKKYLSVTPETKGTLCINYTQKKKKRKTYSYCQKLSIYLSISKSAKCLVLFRH